MEFGLELMAIVRSDLTNTEWEFFNDVVDEIDCIGLGVLFVDLQSANTRRVIDGGVLETPHLLFVISNECQELNIHLNVVTRDLLLISFCMHFAHAGATRQPVKAMASQDTRDRRIRYLYVMVSFQIPNDAHWSKMIFATKI